jgi:hypothetical protein
MAPFDVTYAHEFMIQDEFASAPQHQSAGLPAFPETAGVSGPWPAAPRSFPLVAKTGSQPRSLQTPSYVEFVLQVIDKDSIMTSVIVILAYVKLMLVLSN